MPAQRYGRIAEMLEFLTRNVLFIGFPVEAHGWKEGVCMIANRFEVGDRVRTRVASVGVSAGTSGSVQIQFTAVDNLYEVLFDGRPHPLLMRREELELEAAGNVSTSALGQAFSSPVGSRHSAGPKWTRASPRSAAIGAHIARSKTIAPAPRQHAGARRLACVGQGCHSCPCSLVSCTGL
jgi:hypothetical protein